MAMRRAIASAIRTTKATSVSSSFARNLHVSNISTFHFFSAKCSVDNRLTSCIRLTQIVLFFNGNDLHLALVGTGIFQ